MDPTGEEAHQQIQQSLLNLRSSQALFRRLEIASTKFYAAMQSASEAAKEFYESMQLVGDAALSGGVNVSNLGSHISNVTDAFRMAEQKRREPIRIFADQLMLPLQSRLDMDPKTTTKMEKDYERDQKVFTEELKKAQKEADTWSKKARKFASDGLAASSINPTVQAVHERTSDLYEMRQATLNVIATEEKRRFNTVFGGLTAFLRAEVAFATIIAGLSKVIEGFNEAGSRPEGIKATSSKDDLVRAPYSMSSTPAPSPAPSVAPTPSNTLPPPSSNPAVLAPNQYRVKHAFAAKEPGQLPLRIGDIVTVDGAPEDNWQFGRTPEAEGWFPSGFLARHDEVPDATPKATPAPVLASPYPVRLRTSALFPDQSSPAVNRQPTVRGVPEPDYPLATSSSAGILRQPVPEPDYPMATPAVSRNILAAVANAAMQSPVARRNF